jgi:hypothetical protein
MRLLVIHPDADPGDITRATGLTPSRAWRCGEPRSTPQGTQLEGEWSDTRWSHTFELDKEATIERAIASAIAILAVASQFLASLRQTGGTVELIISLPGDAYQGASIGVERLKALAELGVGLGIEVFP